MIENSVVRFFLDPKDHVTRNYFLVRCSPFVLIAWRLCRAGAFSGTLLPYQRQQAPRKPHASFWRSRWRALKADLDAGLLDKAGYEASVEDVRRRALQDISEARGRTLGGKGAPVATALTVCVLMTVSVLGLYSGSEPQDPLICLTRCKRAASCVPTARSGLTTARRAPAELKAFLETHPKDERAWVLYGRALAQSSDWQGAADAYEKAVSLGRFAGKDTDVLMEYGAATMNLRTEAAYKKAVEILTQAAVIDENNLRVQEFLAMAAFQAHDWKTARIALEFILTKADPNDPAYQSIAEAASQAARMERESRQK